MHNNETPPIVKLTKWRCFAPNFLAIGIKAKAIEKQIIL